jgi:predicted class III extradiol MEMO1 family dioxygenase
MQIIKINKHSRFKVYDLYLKLKEIGIKMDFTFYQEFYDSFNNIPYYINISLAESTDEEFKFIIYNNKNTGIYLIVDTTDYEKIIKAFITKLNSLLEVYY